MMMINTLEAKALYENLIWIRTSWALLLKYRSDKLDQIIFVQFIILAWCI